MPLGQIQFGSGLASGINWSQIVDAIIQAESYPIQQLQERIDTFERAKSSFNELKGLLEDFQSALEELKADDSLGGYRATLSSEDALTATASSSASPGIHTISVSQLAKAHGVRSNGLSDRYSPLVSDGTIEIQAGGYEKITIDVSAANGNNSLQGIADAINAADQGVVASIINDGSSSILVVRAKETGTEHALTITDTTNLDLDESSNELQAAQDAQLVVDGISITSSTNTVTGAIPGVTLNLTDTTTSDVTLTIEEDTDATKEAIESFVEAYNKVNDYFDRQFGTADFQKYSAVAAGNSVRNIQWQLQSLLTQEIGGIPDGNVNTLAELGIVVADSTGRLEFRSSYFDDLVDQGRFDEVKAVLRSSGSTTDSSVVFVTAGTNTASGTYDITVTTAPERAEVAGSTAIQSSGIAQDETLTIGVNGTTTTVDLSAGDTVDTIVQKINNALDAAGLEAVAYSDSGVLKIRAADYGSAYTVTAVSNVADAGDGSSTGIGTTELSDTGVDVVGTIGGQAAEGVGNELIGADGTDMDGLVVRVYATPDSVTAKGGDFGQVGYSRGAADAFISVIEDLVDSYDGTIKSITDGYDDSIEAAQERIERIQARLARRREILTKQFSMAEAAISQLNQAMSSLSGR